MQTYTYKAKAYGQTWRYMQKIMFIVCNSIMEVKLWSAEQGEHRGHFSS